MTGSVLASSPGAVQTLSPEDLNRIAPSVFAANTRPGVSARYTFVSTAQVVELLRNHGWEPVRAAEQRVRLSARRGYQLHEIRFARRTDLRTPRVGGVWPEMILQNAHDGTRAYRIDAGLFRLVCRNGLVLADTDFAHVVIRHLDVSPERFVGAAAAVAAPRVLDRVARWQAVRLSPAERLEFARRALSLRWEADKFVGKFLAPESLLRPVNYGDHQDDLWTVANLLHCHLYRGGDRYRAVSPNGGSHWSTTRPLGAIGPALSVNKRFWSLAEQFARN